MFESLSLRIFLKSKTDNKSKYATHIVMEIIPVTIAIIFDLLIFIFRNLLNLRDL